jgi:hypothetical protein
MNEFKEPKITKDVAEEIGMHIGDGSMGIYKATFHYDYTLAFGLEDEIYASKFVIPLIKRIYKLTPYFQYSKKDNSILLKYCSKKFIIWKQKLGIKPGPKDNITIPKPITNSKFVLDCIRGLFDTDGSISFKSRNKNKHYYPVIRFFSKSRKLVEQIDDILKKEDIISSLYYDEVRHDKRGFTTTGHNLFINGKNNLNKFMEKIGFSNVKHITKYQIWKINGTLKPYTTLKERLAMLQNISRGGSVVYGENPCITER